jgi:hypothetical protein
MVAVSNFHAGRNGRSGGACRARAGGGRQVLPGQGKDLPSSLPRDLSLM